MSANQILMMQENANGDYAIKTLIPEAGKVVGFDSGLNPAMVEVDSSGGVTIQNNGVSLTSRSKLNFDGINLIADNATNDSTDIQMFSNLPPDVYINQNVYPALEWVWRHTDGYWYWVAMVLSRTSGIVGVNNKKFKVYKTTDWVNHIEVCSYENTSYTMINPKIVVDANGNIVVIAIDTNNIRSIFFDATNSYSTTVTANISQNTSNAIETTVSLNVSADNRFGVAFFQKHSGSTSFSQLMYVERSAGSAGTWGTPEILGATPLRATAVTSTGAIQLFYTSANEPIIAFLNNASATSSKVAIAKKVSGTWTIYDSGVLLVEHTAMDSDNNIYLSRSEKLLNKFTYSDNSYTSITGFANATRAINIDGLNNLYIQFAQANPLNAVGIGSIFYHKNNSNTFHRAVRNYFQIGAVISTNALSSMSIYTVIPYSRQRLENAYHLVIRTDGAIYMEVI